MADQIVDLHALQIKLNPKTIFALIVVILAIIASFSSIYMVSQGEEAVVLLFGKFNRTTGPGLHFKLPFGIEKNYNVPTERILKEEFGFRTHRTQRTQRTQRGGVKTTVLRENYSSESVMLTGDFNVVDVTWSIQYRIEDSRAWLFNVEGQRKIIRDISQSAINMLVGDRTASDVVTNGRYRIEEQGKLMMNEFFHRYGLGINVRTVTLQSTKIIKEVTDE
jgi:membrane protease subunit HflK